MKKRVLLCVIPNTSLFAKKSYVEIGGGACYVGGALEHFGYKADIYDLNALLNAKRKKEDNLNADDKAILSNFDFLSVYLERPNKKSLLYDWSHKLLDLIKKDGQKYDYIGLSLDSRAIKKGLAVYSFHFALILAKVFNKEFKAPIYLGGKSAFFSVGYDYLHKLIPKFKKLYISGLFMLNGAIPFAEFLQKNDQNKKLTAGDLLKWDFISSDGKNKISRETMSQLYKDLLFRRKNFKQDNRDIHNSEAGDNGNRESSINNYNILPKYNVRYKEHLMFQVQKLFPKGLVEIYPELRRIKPFYLVPLIFTGGCRYNCSFCVRGGNGFFYAMPAKQVVDNIEKAVKKYKTTYFRFYNTMINFDEKYVLELCHEIIKRNLKIKFSDSADLRCSSREVFQALREAGCVKLWFGAETLHPELLKKIRKGLTPEKIYAGLLEADKAGIWNAVNFIVNFPHENQAEFNFTKNFIEKSADLINCHACNRFQLLGGSHMFVHPQKYGIKNIRRSKERSWGYVFDEINGLCWRDKAKLGKNYASQIKSVYSPFKNIVFSNDYLLFGLSQVVDQKERIKEIMYKYIELAKKGSREEYAELLFDLDTWTSFKKNN